jgi:hypothetical protein
MFALQIVVWSIQFCQKNLLVSGQDGWQRFQNWNMQAYVWIVILRQSFSSFLLQQAPIYRFPLIL